ncbi:MAG: MFS transporter [Spirochaetaceae bacterium]
MHRLKNNQLSLYWHTFFLAITTTFTELNTVMPALILEVGGGESAVGVLTAIMIGVPLVTQLPFASFLHARRKKKPFLLLGINLRVLALGMAATVIGAALPDRAVIFLVFLAMTIFALSGAFAGVSYTEMIGKVVTQKYRGTFFVRRQLFNSLGVLISAIITRFVLGRVPFPEGYAGLFYAAAAVLLIASLGFWALREPEGSVATGPETTFTATAPLPTGSASPTPAPTERERIFPLVLSILQGDKNLRRLLLTTNLIAPAFTALPLITALAHRSYEISGETVGWFVLVQIGGMLISSRLWGAVIRRGGFRLVLWSEAILLGSLLPLALLLSANVGILAYGSVYLLLGATISAHRVGTEAVIVQISPDHQRAIYAGIFGALNLGMALVPILSGTLIARFGFTAVFLVAAAASWAALFAIRGIWCGRWYAE